MIPHKYNREKRRDEARRLDKAKHIPWDPRICRFQGRRRSNSSANAADTAHQ